LHQYAGIGAGEQLGCLFSIWSAMIGVGSQGEALSQIVRLRRGREERQADRERRSFTLPRAQNQTPAHRFGQTAGYEQTQAESTCGLRRSRVHAVETLESSGPLSGTARNRSQLVFKPERRGAERKRWDCSPRERAAVGTVYD
jgi:hypothetical protein